MNRKIPPHPTSVERRIAGSCVDEALLNKMRQAGQQLAAIPHKTAGIRGRDGIRLFGHWMPVDAPKRVIIAMHGWRSSWDNDFGMVGDFLRNNDCSVLYVEQRGQGKSGGKYMGFGLVERYDCLDWIHWVNRQTGGEIPVYLCGVSMGASTVLMTSGLLLPPNVRGIIADCGYTSPAAIWEHVARRHLHLSYRICGGPVNRLAGKRIRMAVDAETCPLALSRSQVPVLFIHGTEDRFVPIEMTFENYKACASPKQLFVVPGAAHGMSYLTDQKGYEAVVQNFWNSFDKKLS